MLADAAAGKGLVCVAFGGIEFVALGEACSDDFEQPDAYRQRAASSPSAARFRLRILFLPKLGMCGRPDKTLTLELSGRCRTQTVAYHRRHPATVRSDE